METELYVSLFKKDALKFAQNRTVNCRKVCPFIFSFLQTKIYSECHYVSAFFDDQE